MRGSNLYLRKIIENRFVEGDEMIGRDSHYSISSLV